MARWVPAKNPSAKWERRLYTQCYFSSILDRLEGKLIGERLQHMVTVVQLNDAMSAIPELKDMLPSRASTAETRTIIDSVDFTLFKPDIWLVSDNRFTAVLHRRGKASCFSFS